ncbi:type VI immunity family protein [Cystobacter fuscus]|uniref:type VI immunity family protein n=1 Tax=Cystobacter fuscus TaxID=43 RepID=UPI00097154C9|nr:type VI immunity family protein [Cystobacter fuscus]
MSAHYPRIRYPAWHGGLLIREGIRICLYMNHPHEEIASKVASSMETYLQAVGPGTPSWSPDYNGDWWELDDSARNKTLRELRDEHASGDLLFKWCDSPESARGYEVEYCGKLPDSLDRNAVSAVSFWLPTEYLEEKGPEHVRELMWELADPLPFCSGHAGLAFNHVGIPRELSFLRFRHPGLDDTELGHVSWNIGTRIRGPAWMNFLGAPVLDELGGVTGLRSRFSSQEVRIQEMPGNRAVVTLGSWPEAGDTEQGRDLPLYREWARALEPWLYQEPRTQYPIDGEETLRWERRFLDR